MSDERPKTCGICGAPDVWCTCGERINIDAYNALRARAEKAEAELAVAQEKNKLTYCLYCGVEICLDDPQAGQKAAAHIRICEKHPMRTLDAELAAVREAHRWIPVGESMPPSRENVIVMAPGFVSIGYVESESWCSLDGLRFPFEVTHWMPMPEPPQDGDA